MKDSGNVVRVWIRIKMDLITPDLDMWCFEWHGRGGELSILSSHSRLNRFPSFPKASRPAQEEGERLWSPKPLTIQAKPASFDVSQLAFNKHFFQSKKTQLYDTFKITEDLITMIALYTSHSFRFVSVASPHCVIRWVCKRSS